MKDDQKLVGVESYDATLVGGDTAKVRGDTGVVGGRGNGQMMDISLYFSDSVGDPYKDPQGVLNYELRDVLLKDDSGKVTQEIKGVTFPKDWSQHASNTVATKYFRREGIPGTGREKDIRQLIGRVGRKISRWGVEQEYFGEGAAGNLEKEIAVASAKQIGAYNSPVWFSVGLDSYGLEKESEAYTIDSEGNPILVTNVYANPQASACFILSPEDSIEDMIKVGAVDSAKIFRNGSGIGGDWSHIRSAGEPVTGGGQASGASRFMDVQDATGRVIKSGGITRRAATMQSIAIWHGDAIEVLKHKYKEDVKGRVLIGAGSPHNWESHTFQDLRGQNVNISIRTDDAFWNAYANGDEYSSRRVTDNSVISTRPAKDLATIMAFAAHSCGDPGIQYHGTINRWNTCKNSGEIWASNPCSEYMFLNDSACNLASINLMKFRMDDGGFDVEGFQKAVDLYITTQDIIVSKASYPTKEVARNSHEFRPLGLGYANLGAFIMANGWAYDSDDARNFASAVTALMTSRAYLQSTKLAEAKGAFVRFEENKEPMLEVIGMHKKAALKISKSNGLENIVNAANSNWETATERGGKFGFRNSQVTLLAPTGTIGFMMDCDTTGGEPEFQLIKYKELAGGGSMTIINDSVSLALKNLGYDPDEIKSIVEYINQDMGEDPKKPSLRGTVEGCKLLKDEHLSVFDCAVTSPYGQRSIHPMGHIRMLEAIQPHLSGAISKTVNCPEETTVEEFEYMMHEGHKRGIKALALYRNNSKAAQPLTTGRAGSNDVRLGRGERRHIPSLRQGITQKIKVGEIPLFLRTGEYGDGTLGELFIDSLERGSEVNRLLNVVAVEFSEKLQYGVPLKEAIEIFDKAGKSQISGMTDHKFIKMAHGPEGFIFDWVRAHYLGDISFITPDMLVDTELRPLPEELRVYEGVPKLHLMPMVSGEKMYPGVPSLEETIERISGTNYWKDNGLDTRQTIDKIKRTRSWGREFSDTSVIGRISGKICKCGTMMIGDGKCDKCPKCRTSTGGCG